MVPQTVRAWLAGYYSEEQVRERVGGTRQNWSKRRPSLREAAGIEILPGAWLYERKATDAHLARRPRRTAAH